MEKPKPAFRGKYSIRNWFWNLIFRGMDGLIRILVTLPQCFRNSVTRVPEFPQHILICNGAHLGDVIASTSVLPALQSAFPTAKFSYILGSWSQAILIGHPLIQNVHIVDHWMLNRANLSKWEKWRIYRRTRAQTLREISLSQYDIAIDLYWNLPNSLPLLWQSGIPIRVAFGSAGFGPLATHCLELSDSRKHISELYRNLLELLGVVPHDLAKMSPSLPPVSIDGRAQLDRELSNAGIYAGNYLVFHPGASAGFREWQEENWRSLTEQMTSLGHHIVFTGYSDLEAASIQRIIGNLPHCLNLCGQLSWQSYVAAIQLSRLLVCVDTVAGHVAGAMGTSSVIITSGRYPYLWKPMGAASHVLTASVPCAPCHLNHGCVGMECIRNLAVAQVMQACHKALEVSSDICVDH